MQSPLSWSPGPGAHGMQLRLMGRERAGSWGRRGEGERKELLGGLTRHRRVPAVREGMLLTWLGAQSLPSPLGEPQEHGGTARGDKSQGFVTEVGGGCGGQWAQSPPAPSEGAALGYPAPLLSWLSSLELLCFILLSLLQFAFPSSGAKSLSASRPPSSLHLPIPGRGGPRASWFVHSLPPAATA